MIRTYVSDLKASGEFLVEGWVHEARELAKMKFILLRDSTGIVQCVIKQGTKGFDQALTLETVVAIRGKAKSAKLTNEMLTQKSIELEVESLEILNKAEELPIQVNEKSVTAELPTRLDNRSLDIRKPKIAAIFKVQSAIANAFREFFYTKKFVEIQPPGIIATSTEGGTDLFEAKYFDRKAYLAQSPQLYKQLTAISMEKVFLIMPVWRAEKHDTTKHINEIRQMDIEVAFSDDMAVMKYLEECVQHIFRKVMVDCKDELAILGRELKVPKAKYLTYKEAVALMVKSGIKMKEGDDFEPEAERKLCSLFPDTIIFTYEWPSELKPFYIWPKDLKKGITGGFDALYGGMEISSGGQRVHVPEILIKQLKAKKLKPEDFKWYIDAFRYGAPQHAGWSIGLERMTQTMLGLDNIREATLFPRDRKRLTP